MIEANLTSWIHSQTHALYCSSSIGSNQVALRLGRRTCLLPFMMMPTIHRAHELCESRGGRLGLPVLNSPYSLLPLPNSPYSLLPAPNNPYNILKVRGCTSGGVYASNLHACQVRVIAGDSGLYFVLVLGISSAD